MKCLIFLAACLSVTAGLIPSLSRAEEGPAAIPFREDVGNLPSAQRGARDFMAYCSGCHAMKYLRYNRLAKDLDIPDDLLKSKLMLGTDKLGDPIPSSMPVKQAEAWFGRSPPDLTLETKARGTAWVYSYLQSFYLDDKRPLGVNNPYLPGVSMPAVLGELQGWQKLDPPAKGEEDDAPKFELVQAGTMSPQEYKEFIADLTNFMAYASEPGKSDRISLGFRVILYLLVLLVLTYFLKKEFWRDVH